MSEIINLIRLKQPVGFKPTKGEILKMQPQRCEKCNGRGGWVTNERSYGYDPTIGETATVCPVCKGTGEVSAQIVIGWESSGTVKELFK